MGEYRQWYEFISGFVDGDPERLAKSLVIGDAINAGYTPNGEPILTWNAATHRVKAVLPVTENTQDGH